MGCSASNSKRYGHRRRGEDDFLLEPCIFPIEILNLENIDFSYRRCKGVESAMGASGPHRQQCRCGGMYPERPLCCLSIDRRSPITLDE